MRNLVATVRDAECPEDLDFLLEDRTQLLALQRIIRGSQADAVVVVRGIIGARAWHLFSALGPATAKAGHKLLTRVLMVARPSDPGGFQAIMDLFPRDGGMLQGNIMAAARALTTNDHKRKQLVVDLFKPNRRKFKPNRAAWHMLRRSLERARTRGEPTHYYRRLMRTQGSCLANDEPPRQTARSPRPPGPGPREDCASPSPLLEEARSPA